MRYIFNICLVYDIGKTKAPLGRTIRNVTLNPLNFTKRWKQIKQGLSLLFFIK
jgi:hypothetical protein